MTKASFGQNSTQILHPLHQVLLITGIFFSFTVIILLIIKCSHHRIQFCYLSIYSLFRPDRSASYNLYHVVLDYDAELAEVNPLVETDDGSFVVADARLIVDDNALYRHPDLREKALERDLTSKEAEAGRHGLSYVDLEGDIGIIGNGAGLVMATLDLVQLCGGAS